MAGPSAALPGVRVFDLSDPKQLTEITGPPARRRAVSPPPAETPYVGRHRAPHVPGEDTDEEDGPEKNAESKGEGRAPDRGSAPSPDKPHGGSHRMREVG